ncbi:LysM peptidoglycan-binding domain-containing protein [Roseibium algae]|uniref:LysM peptidoglycan-binding domain-containing protein n=1 Tax=Roseibium algae TaxID=3123038 RepID=A0ABU8TPG3_9HYPH
MTQLALIRALILAAIVGSVAVVTGIFYIGADRDQLATAPNTDQETVPTAASDNAPASDASSVADLGKKPDVAQKSDAAQTVASDVPEATTASASDESISDQVADNTPASGETLSFDVVGVEPTGDAVVAGRAEPGSIVALVANGSVVGKTVANTKGEWTMILDRPLDAGDYDVGLQVQDDNGNATHESSQRLTVSIPEDGKDQPLVVLSSPDAPSTVLQKAAVAEPMIAPVPDAADEQEVVVAAADPIAEAAAPKTPATTTLATSLDAKAAAEASSPQSITTLDETAADPVSADLEEDPSSEKGLSAPQTSESDTAVTEEQAVAAAEPAQAVATAQQETAPAAKPEPLALVVTVDAVEAELGKVYVAGTGNADLRVQVYLGDIALGTVTVGDNDRWLVEGAMALAPGAVEVRADMIGQDGQVVGRAAVTFEKEAEAIVLTRAIAAGETNEDGAVTVAKVAKPLPNVIIRKGDNLWRISRRLYGDGVRYTTIYQANKGQIRNPDLIYPGQVFLTPEGDLNWDEKTQ